MPARHIRGLSCCCIRAGTPLCTPISPAAHAGTVRTISPGDEGGTALLHRQPVLPHPAPQPAPCTGAALGAQQAPSCQPCPPNAAHRWWCAAPPLGWCARAPTAVPGASALRLPAAAPAASQRPEPPAPRRPNIPGSSLVRASPPGVHQAGAGEVWCRPGRLRAVRALPWCRRIVRLWGLFRAKSGAARRSSTHACRGRVGSYSSSRATTVSRRRWQAPIRRTRRLARKTSPELKILLRLTMSLKAVKR